MKTARVLPIVLLTALTAVFAGCGGAHGGGALPPTLSSLIPTVISRSPASVAVPPLQGISGTRPAMDMRKPQSSISALNFTQLPGAAVEVAASPDGTFWVLSTQGLPNGDKFIYHWNGSTFVNVPGAALHISVAPDNTPWVLNSAGGIYHLVNGAFTGIAGGASEISAGGTASAVVIDVISNQSPGPYGAGIFQYTTASGTWAQLPGAGVTVAASIDPTGSYPALNIAPAGFYVTNQLGGIYYHNPGGFTQLPGGAVSLAPTASGGLFALGNPGAYQHGIYYNDLSSGTWTQMPGAAISLSANSVDVFAIGAAGGIYESPITASGSGGAAGGGAILTGPNLGYATGYNIGGWGPTAVANALQFPVQSGFDGSGYTIAIVGNGNVNPSDLAKYTAWFQTPSTGRAITYEVFPGASQINYTGEAALDLETVAGLAPGANLILYTVPNLDSVDENNAYNYIVANRTANIVSLSFAGCEAPVQSLGASDSVQSAIFASGASEGITFIAASGDQGSACPDGTSGSQQLYAAGVGYPASDPNVIGVGGNETYPLQNVTPLNPVVWDDNHAANNALEASGGGVSVEFSLPSYQAPVAGKASAQFRNVPDVALPAAYAATVVSGSWQLQGGTSWAAPEFAAMMAEVYQYCNTAFNDAANVPYAVFAKSGYSAFTNITSGNNAYPLSGGVLTPTYYASSGYNNATGIGIPLGMPFAESLCPGRVASIARSTMSVKPTAVARTAQAYAVDAAPAIRGLVDRGRKPLSEVVQIQLGIVPGIAVSTNEAAVIGTLEANGFTIVQTFSNHLLVDASGTTASVEKLFATQMHNALQGSRIVYLPEMPITVPASIAPYASGVIIDNVVNRFYPSR